ncbi:MAG: DEAD/DEAH box helicase domain-containing protein [Parcubacteria group bacterium Gr01-1014_56]|nr:MAG: DEAD/DEAH box helicase domain-containing protein [Parcubacteria group bacterium Gr01-1014_56]
MKRITFDIETIGDFGPQGDFSKQEITVVGIHDSESDRYSSFLRDELAQLWPILERADLLVGYNSDHFDIPILNRYYTGDLTKIKSLDLLKEIKNVLGRRLRLDSVAEGTLGRGKIGHGLEAQKWWAAGEFEKVREYCLDDVKLTKEIYDYARKNNSLKYMDYEGPREIKLDTSKWEEEKGSSLTHTLPF